MASHIFWRVGMLIKLSNVAILCYLCKLWVILCICKVITAFLNFAMLHFMLMYFFLKLSKKFHCLYDSEIMAVGVLLIICQVSAVSNSIRVPTVKNDLESLPPMHRGSELTVHEQKSHSRSAVHWSGVRGPFVSLYFYFVITRYCY